MTLNTDKYYVLFWKTSSKIEYQKASGCKLCSCQLCTAKCSSAGVYKDHYHTWHFWDHVRMHQYQQYYWRSKITEINKAWLCFIARAEIPYDTLRYSGHWLDTDYWAPGDDQWKKNDTGWKDQTWTDLACPRPFLRAEIYRRQWVWWR